MKSPCPGSWNPTRRIACTCHLPLFAAALLAAIFLRRTPSLRTNSEIETVVVTATRTPTPEAQVASSITVVTAADIAAKQAQTCRMRFRTYPGLNVVQTGGPGGADVGLHARNGFQPRQGAGRRHRCGRSSSPNGAFDFGQFLTPDIERIEILRGPQSGLYGSDAIGGVINIITKAAPGRRNSRPDVEGGSFDTFNQSAGVSGSTGPFHYAANIEHFYSGATPVTPLDLLAPGEARLDDSYDNVTGSTKLGYDVADNFDLGLVARYTNTQLLFTGDNYNVPPFTGVPDSTHDQTDTLQYYTRGRTPRPVRRLFRADAWGWPIAAYPRPISARTIPRATIPAIA
jgi:vitamin B12 transporter